MKKGVIIGCSIFAVVILVIAIACGGFLYYQGSQFMAKNTEITEKIIGNKIPAGYMAFFAMDMKNKTNQNQQNGDKFAVLIGKNNHIIILVEGPPISSDEDKQELFNKFQEGMQESGHGSAGQSFEITPDGKMNINGKEVEKYKISMTSKGKSYIGMALFLDSTSNTILYACLAETKVYDSTIAIEFAKAIKQ